MKIIAKVLSLITMCSLWVFGQDVEPCTQTAKLSTSASGVQTFTSNSNGNQSLGGSGDLAYGYEMWTEGGNNNKLIYFGLNQGGGMAFRTEWNEPNDYLGRIGFYWGNSGKKWNQYKNIYADFNFTRSANGTGGSYSYIGIYGWTLNPMMEWYIIDDWFGTGQLGPNTICYPNGCNSLGSITVDGGTYNIYTFTRPAGSGNILSDGNAFPQIFSIRQNRRICGTISVTEHFKAWTNISSISGYIGNNTYEAKFLAEAGGGTGWFELSYLKMAQEDNPRGSTPSGSSSSTGGGTSSSSGDSEICGEYQPSFCGGMAFANVLDKSTAIPSTGSCLFIGGFETIQPDLNSAVSINGVENTCGNDWDPNEDDLGLGCPWNEKPATKDGGYYVYVKTGTINEYQNNGWQDIVAGTKPECQTTPIINKVPLTHFSVRASGKALLVEASSPATVEIYNLRGRKAATFNVSNASQTVNLSLPSGVYFAKVRGASTQHVRFVLR